MASNVVELVPRAPIVYNQKSGTLDRQDNYKSHALAWRAAARTEALETLKLNPERDFIRTYCDFLEGRYWDRRRAKYRSTFFDNRLAEARLEGLCSLTDLRPTMEISNSQPGVEQYERQAEIVSKIIKSIWDTENLDLATESAADHAMLSVGYWKIGATMGNDYLGARTVILPCGMDSVFKIQPGRDIQDSSAVLYRYFNAMHRVKQGYGMAADGLEREVTGGYVSFVGGTYPDSMLPDYSFNPMNPAIRMQTPGRSGIVMASEGGPFAAVEVEEYWIDDPSINESIKEVQVKDQRLSLAQHNYHYRVPPGERLFPRKRLMVWAGSQILYDGPAPYWHGLYPFSELILRPAVWRAGGISVYRNLVPLQLAMNKAGAGVLDQVERAVDPQMAFSDGALDDTSYKQYSPDRHGATLKMSHSAQWGLNARFMDPPPLPAYVGAFIDRVDQAFSRQSGAMDVAGMSNKGQVPGGEVWEAVRDSVSTIKRLDARHIEPFMRAAGTQMVSNIIQFYTRNQRMRMLGKDGITWEDFDYDAGSMVPWSVVKENHWRNFPVNIAAGSMHSGARDREKQLSVSLFRLGGISRREMLRKLGYGETQMDQIEKEIADEHGGDITPDATGKGAVPRLTRGQRTGQPF